MKSLLLILLLVPVIAWAQSPGGVSANLTLWLKANSSVYSDAGVTAITDGGTVQQWNDQSSTPKNATQATAGMKPVYKSNATDQINYNPLLYFDGTKGMDLASNALSTGSNPYDIYSASANTSNANATAQLIFTQGNNVAARTRVQMGYKHNSNSSIQVLHNWIADGYILSSSAVIVDVPNIIEYGYDKTNSNRKSVVQGIDNSNNTPTGTLGLTSNSHIGYEVIPPSTFTSWMIGNIPEVIVYTDFKTSTDRIKVQSYLALKYGITLSNSQGGIYGDYLSSAGTTIWDASDNSGYHNNVVGIGRDDASALVQNQSHQMDDSTRIYLSSLATTNAGNSGSFSSDQQFVMMGNNGGILNANGHSTEYPTGQGIYSRIGREWKITNTSFTGTFSMDVTMNTTPITASDLRILIDDDGDFTNATMYNPTISYSSGVVTVSGISNSLIPANSTKYLTIVSLSSATPLPVALVDFTATAVNNKEVQLSWQTATETNNDYFLIERSKDGVSWQELSKINGAGNSSQLLSYSYNDNDPIRDISYYRLKQTDMDRNYTYSPVRTVTIDPLSGNKVAIYPNPATDQITVEGNKEEISVIHIYDMMGKDVSHYVTIIRNNDTQVVIKMASLPADMYTIKTKTAAYQVRKE